MVDKLQDALTRLGIKDDVVAGALFFPRGHFGGAIAGGVVGGELGDQVGGLAGGVGTAGGVLAGQRAADAASGLPERMLVGVSATTVYGFDTRREHGREPTDLIFQVPRSQLDVRVHQRVNVRVRRADRYGHRCEGGAGGRAHARLRRGGCTGCAPCLTTPPALPSR
jgi:hypothetical protein